jgi:UDP-N-acetylglucosamine diphosphorylase/glucosamine-1-phosphate N-acetyltransferase
MRVAFFEDSSAAQLHPLTLLRPVFELLCGHFSLRERVVRCLDVTEWGAFVRPHLADPYREEHPEARVNDADWLAEGPTLLINGRWLPDMGNLRHLAQNDSGVVDGEIAWLTLDPDERMLLSLDNWNEDLARIARSRKRVDAGGELIRYPWDLVDHNARQIEADFALRERGPSRTDTGPQTALLGGASSIYIDFAAQVDPFVVVDARGGPVWIDAGAKVLPFTRIEGPAYIGRETQLFRAHVRAGTSIGPLCRVGGEIEESIFHGYSNKYHDGFLGHSYVCPWVNLGAQTTNSDLKNDYSQVRVPLDGVPVDTDSTKVGCFIGDHTKTALGCLFNTGSSIGVMCMVLPGGELLPKHVPSFTRVWHGRVEPLPDGGESSIAAARTALGRRNRELSSAQERLLRDVWALTSQERRRALDRARRSVAPIPDVTPG